jgi:hypothetical protein
MGAFNKRSDYPEQQGGGRERITWKWSGGVGVKKGFDKRNLGMYLCM